MNLTLAETPYRSYEGECYSVNPATSLVTVITKPETSSSTYSSTNSNSNAEEDKKEWHFINTASISDFKVLSAPKPAVPSTASTAPRLENFDQSFLQSRLNKAVANAKEALSRQGKNVSKEAQEIFDAIIKTLPLKWDGQNIVVMEQVVIEKPYTAGDCRAFQGTQPAVLERVRKVLENERKKLAEKDRGRKTAIPSVVPKGERKGG